MAVCLPEIKVQLSFALMEEFRSVGEGSVELLLELLSDVVAAWSYAGSNGCDQIFRARVVVGLHGCDSLLYDPCDRTSPSSMEGGDDALAGVRNENRDAVCSQDRKQDSRNGSGKTIRLNGAAWCMQCRWFADGEDTGAVYLFHGSQWEWPREAKRLDETAAVFDHRVRGIVGCEAEVKIGGTIVCGAVVCGPVIWGAQVCGFVDRRDAAVPRAEAVNQPGKAKPFVDLERSDGGVHCGCLSRGLSAA